MPIAGDSRQVEVGVVGGDIGFGGFGKDRSDGELEVVEDWHVEGKNWKGLMEFEWAHREAAGMKPNTSKESMVKGKTRMALVCTMAKQNRRRCWL
jgi:hypothetical protein